MDGAARTSCSAELLCWAFRSRHCSCVIALLRVRMGNTVPARVLLLARPCAAWHFAVMAVITALSAFSENGLVINLAALLTDHGVTAQSAALALSVRGGAGIVGRLCVGFLIDRFSPQRMQTFILILAGSGTLIFAFAGTAAVALVGAALLGVGLGSEADVAPYLLARYFGRKHFSVLYGLTWTAYAIGGGIGR